MDTTVAACRFFALAYPILLPLSFYAAWFAAWLSLGRRPQPSIDDPKSIGLVVDVLHFLAGFAVILLPAFGATILGLLAFAACDRDQRKLNLWVAALSIAMALLSIRFLQLDPYRVVGWYMD